MCVLAHSEYSHAAQPRPWLETRGGIPLGVNIVIPVVGVGGPGFTGVTGGAATVVALVQHAQPCCHLRDREDTPDQKNLDVRSISSPHLHASSLP